MKKLIILTIFVFTILFSCTIIAQQMRSLRITSTVNIPKKIQKLVLDPLPAGTYTIGTAGDFPTIDSAFNKLSVDGISGPVTFELIDTLYTAPSDSLGFFLNGPIPGADQNNRVTIKPAENKNVTIAGEGHLVFRFNNTSYLTLDGIALTGNSTLTIHALQNSRFTWNDPVDFVDNSDHNVVQNITAISEDFMRVSDGIGFWAEDNINSAPDSNLIFNNFIKKAGWGILIQGGGTQRAKGNIIRGNFIGSETDSLIGWGIQLADCQNTLVERNIIQNLKVTANLSDNTINVGINSYWGNGDIIRNNIVHNIKSNAGYTSTGILLSGASNETGSNDLVYDNMVYDIQSTSSESDSRVAGIQMWCQNNPKIYYNTVYLSGNGANHEGSAAFYIYSGFGNSTNVEAKNNIFVNTRDESPYCASSIYNYTTSNLVSDNNDLYDEQNQYNCVVRIGGTKYNTLTDWQVTGKDLNSITEMPNFKSPYLHIDESTPTNLEKRAVPIAGITTDFDGDSRDAYLPDIGADEFNGQVESGPLMSGYSIGTTGYFPTIDSAFKRLSDDGISGPVTLELIDTLYTAPTDTNGFLLKGPIPGTDKNNRVIIRPTTNKNVIIESSGKAVVTCLNTSYVTFDGAALTGSTSLTFHALHNNQFTENDCLDFLYNSDHNIIENITFISEDYNRGNSLALWAWQNGVAPDSNLIQNNIVKSSLVGILISAYYSSNRAEGNIVRKNYLGSEVDSLIAWGIHVQHCHNTIVENNIVQHMTVTSSDAANVDYGIASYWGSADTIRNNIVHSVKSSAERTGTGILLSGDPGSYIGNNNLVYNNMVYDIQSTSTELDSRVAGIQMWHQSNPKVYYNSVYLTGKGSSPYGSAALYIYYDCSNVEAKNNILVNKRDESPYWASSIYDYTTSNLVSDNNDLYDEQNQYNCVVRIGGTKYNTLTDWQVTGKDLNSITEMPNFKSPYLHIDESIPTNLESHGISIAGINTDIDGDKRGTDSTDIGADEFNGKTVVGVNDKVTQPLVYNLEQNYPNPFNPSTKIKYSIPKQSYVTLKVYDILGREAVTLVNEEKPAGNYEVDFNAQQTTDHKQLSSGVYFYQIKAGDYVSTKKMILLK